MTTAALPRGTTRPTSVVAFRPGVVAFRPGAGTALIGSYGNVADRMKKYHAVGIDEFLLSGYPHLEGAYRVGEGLTPELRRRGMLAGGGAPAPTGAH